MPSFCNNLVPAVIKIQTQMDAELLPAAAAAAESNPAPVEPAAVESVVTDPIPAAAKESEPAADDDDAEVKAAAAQMRALAERAALKAFAQRPVDPESLKPIESLLLQIFPTRYYDLYYDEVRRQLMVRLNENCKNIKTIRASEKVRHVPFPYPSLDEFRRPSEQLLARTAAIAGIPSCPVFTSGLAMLMEPLGRFSTRELVENLQLMVEKKHPDLLPYIQNLYQFVSFDSVKHAEAYEIVNDQIMPLLFLRRLEDEYLLAGRIRYMVDRRRPGIELVAVDPYVLTRPSIDVYLRYWQAWFYLCGKYNKNGMARLESEFRPKHVDMQTPEGQWSRLIDQLNELERRIMSLCKIPQKYWEPLMTSRTKPRAQDVDNMCMAHCNGAVRQMMAIELSYRHTLRANIEAIRAGKPLPFSEEQIKEQADQRAKRSGTTVVPGADDKERVTGEIVKQMVKNQSTELAAVAASDVEMTPEQLKEAELEAAEAARAAIKAAEGVTPDNTAAALETIKDFVEKSKVAAGVTDPAAEVGGNEPVAPSPKTMGQQINKMLDHHRTIAIVPLSINETTLEQCAGAHDYQYVLTLVGAHLAEYEKSQIKK